MKLRAVIFAVLVCTVLYGPFLLGTLTNIGLSFPESITSDSAKYLSGGMSDTEIWPYLNIESFADESLQKASEDTIERYIPAKRSVLLANAKVQRCAIFASSFLTGIQSDATFFKSRFYYTRENHALSEKALSETIANQDNLKSFGEGLANIAQLYPDKVFCVIMADDSQTSSANPAVRKASDSITTSQAVQTISDECKRQSNIAFPDTFYDSEETYYRYFYTTDHHWNGWGAVDAYLKASDTDAIKRKFDLGSSLNDLRSQEGLNWIRENGSYCRYGLMLLNERANEPFLDVFNVKVDGKTNFAPVSSKNGLKKLKKAGPIVSYDFYQTWYGKKRNVQLTNENAPIAESDALIICDSYGTAFRWIAAKDFKKVSIRYDMHNDQKASDVVNLKQSIEECDADIVFIVGREQSFENIPKRYASYFSTE